MIKSTEKIKSIEIKEESIKLPEILERKIETIKDLEKFGQEVIENIDNKSREMIDFGDQLLEKAVSSVGGTIEDIEDGKKNLEEINHEVEFLSTYNKENIKILTGKTMFEEPIVEEEPKGPPIKPGEIFDPEEEFKKLKEFHGKEGLQKAEEYEEKLMYQKFGLGEMEEFLTKKIKENPDIPLDELQEIVEQKFSSKYGLTDKQKEITNQILKEYSRRHQAIRDFREKYPNDKDLFYVLFRKEPKGKIEIIEGPITFYIRCHDEKDYALIYNQKFLKKEEVSKEDIERANQSGGVAIRTALQPELAGAIIAEKVNGRKFDDEAKSILAHEEQHAIKRLFAEVWLRESNWPNLFAAKTDEERTEQLEKYFRFIRERYMVSQAKNEILAYYQGGTKPSDIYLELTKSESKGGLYDYFKKLDLKSTLDNLQENLIKNFENRLIDSKVEEEIREKASLNFKKETVDLFKKLSQEIFEKEYHRILAEGVVSFDILRKKIGQDKTLAILMNEPLERWPIVLRRFKKFLSKKETTKFK